MSFQNPGAEMLQTGNREHLPVKVLLKNRVPDMGGKLCEKTESKTSWTLFLFTPFLPHAWDSVFSEHLNWQVLLITRLQLFSTRVLETHLGGLNAACIGSALSKFRLSVGDGAT